MPILAGPNERLALEPVESITRGDTFAKRRALYCVAQGKESAPLQDLIAATNDSDVYVRRAALRAMEKSKDPAAQAAEEAALRDPENCVQCQAAVILGSNGDPHAIDPIFDAVGRDATFQFDYVAAISALTALAPKDMDAILRRTEDSNSNVRRVALQTLETLPAGAFASARDVLMKAATNDSDPWIREMAFGALARYRFDPKVVDLMTKALNDHDETIQVRAASYLTWLVFTSAVTPFNPEAGKSAVVLPDTQESQEARLDDPTRFNLAAPDRPNASCRTRHCKICWLFLRNMAMDPIDRMRIGVGDRLATQSAALAMMAAPNFRKSLMPTATNGWPNWRGAWCTFRSVSCPGLDAPSRRMPRHTCTDRPTCSPVRASLHISRGIVATYRNLHPEPEVNRPKSCQRR